MVKATYRFEAKAFRAEMIIDECTLYIPRGHQYDAVTFDDDKTAAKAFNKVMMEKFNPKDGWRITEKRVGEAKPPHAHQMVGYVPPEGEATGPVDLAKQPWNVCKNRLILNCDTLDEASLTSLLTERTPSAEHIYLYARSSAVQALSTLGALGAPVAKTLTIDAFDQTNTRQAHCIVGNLSSAIAKMPALEKLFAIGELDFTTTIAHPTLQSVSLLSNPFSAGLLKKLMALDAPLLARVQLGLSAEGDVDDDLVDKALPVFVQKKAGQLKQLSLSGDFDVEDMLNALMPVAASLPPVLSVLGYVVDEEQIARAILALAKKTQLRALGVPSGEIGEDTLALLEEKLPGVVLEIDPLFTPAETKFEKFLEREALPTATPDAV